MPVVPSPIVASDPVDLITGPFAEQVLAAGGVALNDAQSAILGSLITAASREMIRFCNRKFGLATYIDILAPEGARQERGEPASAKLSAFPVQSVTSVLTGRSGVLAVRNSDTSTNQFASVKFTFTGDPEYHDLSYTGLSLSRVASGVTTAAMLSFATYSTLQALATAITALGNGWSATVQGNYGLYPSVSLVGVREPKDALSNGATLDLFTTPATSYDIDRASGILRCYGGGSGLGGFYGAFGDPFGDGVGGYGGYLGWGQWRVEYQAGFATIPADLQLLCAEVVKGMFARLSLNDQMKSQSGGSAEESWSWTARDAIQGLPEGAMRILNKYKDGWI